MAPRSPSLEDAEKYREWVMRLCPREEGGMPLWPGFTALKEFIQVGNACKAPPETSIVNIPGESSPASEFSILTQDHPWNLLEELPSLADSDPSSQLIIVENICPNTLNILGGAYGIDPQFFAQHVNVLSWYRMDEAVPERLNSLPSTKKEEDFLVFRYVEAREIELADDAGSILRPDPTGTRIEHTAGKLEPISKPGITFPRMAFTRQTVSVWCQKKTSGLGWIAIMLLDSPFQLPKKQGSVGQAEYRNPNIRPKMDEQFDGYEIRRTFRRAFCKLLEQRCSADSTYLKACATDTFLLLYEGYRIMASEWLVVNEYVKRELASIEHHLEKSESTFRDLERYLRELYRIRRRCNKDRELVTEAATQCKKRGQALWPSSEIKTTSTATISTSPAARAPQENNDVATLAHRHAQELEADLQYVLDSMGTSIARVEKNMTLVMALVTISEGRQGLQENRGIAFLTLIATVFLPFGTVAAILGIQTQYGPGGTGFWILWAIALPLTLLVVSTAFVYQVAGAALRRLWLACVEAVAVAVALASKPATAVAAAAAGPSGEPQGDAFELPNYSLARKRQASMHDVV